MRWQTRTEHEKCRKTREAIDADFAAMLMDREYQNETLQTTEKFAMNDAEALALSEFDSARQQHTAR